MQRSRFLTFAAGLIAFAGLASAQEYRHFTFNVGGGFTTATQNTSNFLDNGGNVQAGAGLNVNRWLGLNGTFTFNGLGVTRSALNTAGTPDGTSRIYTFTVDPKIRFPLGNGNAFYVTGGGGWMRRTVDFTQPTVASTVFFDPFWGYYPGYVTGNQVIGTTSQDAGVWDVGAGFNFAMPKTHWKMYLEARYYDGMTYSHHTTVVPITFGFRW